MNNNNNVVNNNNNLNIEQPINLHKDSIIKLDKNIQFNKLLCSLGYNEDYNSTFNFDINTIIYCRNKDKSWNTLYTCHYSQVKTPNNAIIYNNPNDINNKRKYEKEFITIQLDLLPSCINCIYIQVEIYNADIRQQHFGDLQHAFFRIENIETKEEICRFTLSNEYGGYFAILIGILIKDNHNIWNFKAIGKGIKKLHRIVL